jgi:hypothetical protein
MGFEGALPKQTQATICHLECTGNHMQTCRYKFYAVLIRGIYRHTHTAAPPGSQALCAFVSKRADMHASSLLDQFIM